MTPASAARRLALVQQPVIPVMGELIQKTPGTLSLGQGMVHWAPPQQVRQAIAAAFNTTSAPVDPYGPVAGDPALREALRQ